MAKVPFVVDLCPQQFIAELLCWCPALGACRLASIAGYTLSLSASYNPTSNISNYPFKQEEETTGESLELRSRSRTQAVGAFPCTPR